MNKLILSGLSVFVMSTSLLAQNKSFDPQNARPGETVEYCTQHKKHVENLADPDYANAIQANEQFYQQYLTTESASKQVDYVIPVVFHLLHNNGIEHISDAQIMSALDVLNRDYERLNADADVVDPEFYAAEVHVQFALATKAPDGTCFTGITHTIDPITDNGSNGYAQVQAIVDGNDVYNGTWAGNKYLNIFIAGDIGGAAGYTNYPSGNTGMTNGIWILHNYCGEIGTSSTYTSRSLTHEVGHWLNLPHTWGSTNSPGIASNCNSDDGVQDTPECIGADLQCNINSNTCSGDNGYWGYDKKDNIENYMEYSYCSKMFTEGQATRMRAALNSGIGGRNNVVSASNLANTGADGNVYLCKADFTADKTTICAGESITFEDMSYNSVNGWNWTFTGGSPATSTDQNPVITYPTQGIYQVVLNATDGSNNDSETKTAYIRVLPAPASLPFLESFESYTSLTGIEEWEVNDEGNNQKFNITTNAAHTGSKSAKLQNYGQSAGNIDELISSPVDLSGITSATNVALSFRYSYRQRSASDNEILKVMITNNCGNSWTVRKTIQGSLLSNQQSTSAWTPASIDDWVTVHMTNVTSSYWVENFRYKFRFESDGGNNLYIDDINIYAGTPSDDIITADASISELDQVSGLAAYPNPTDGDLSVRFDVSTTQQMNVNVTDLTGKVLQVNTVNANQGTNVVIISTSDFASGVYFLNVASGNTMKTIQFVVQ